MEQYFFVTQRNVQKSPQNAILLRTGMLSPFRRQRQLPLYTCGFPHLLPALLGPYSSPVLVPDRM